MAKVILFVMYSLVQLSEVQQSEEKINVANLTGKIGILPIKLGTAKVQEYVFTLFHYYDLNPIIFEVGKLQKTANQMILKIDAYEQKSPDFSNTIAILTLTKNRVESKLKNILPQSRFKRGMYNGIGSIFKSVTGNLDASDGERYEKLIANLERNQVELKEQNAIAHSMMRKFNDTLELIKDKDKELKSKINSINIVLNFAVIKDVLNQIIHTYGILDSILQDIENAITFATLKTMHPSIIKIWDLYIELLEVQSITGLEQMPLKVTLENTPLIEKLIQLECFILNNKIIYLLKIPIMRPTVLDYFHLYSIPIWYRSHFKVVIPRNKYLLQNKWHYAYQGQQCQKVKDQSYICSYMDLEEINKNSPCTVKLLDSPNDVSTCQQVEIKIKDLLIKQLDKSRQWVLVLPKEEVVTLKCDSQEESHKMFGTFLLTIPNNCQVITENKTITNYEKNLFKTNESLLFPDFKNDVELLSTLDLSTNDQEVKLDGLYEFVDQIRKNQSNPSSYNLTVPNISTVPSLWILLIFAFIILGTLVFIFYRIIVFLKSRRSKQNNSEKLKSELELKSRVTSYSADSGEITALVEKLHKPYRSTQ